MSNIRIFYPEKLSINLETNLTKSQSHYLLKVMRIKQGETFSVFNKSGIWKINSLANFPNRIFSFWKNCLLKPPKDRGNDAFL